jgi:hypothetical protein
MTEKSNLTLEQLQDAGLGFYDWFCEIEGFHVREERFWDAIERKDSKELLAWLKTAWKLGYEQGASANGTAKVKLTD